MDLVPEGRCGAWIDHPGLVFANVVADLSTAAAYFVIAAIVVGWLRRRHVAPLRHIFWLFGAFITACGLTHVMGAVVFYFPAFVAEAWVKVACAAVSVLTACLLVPLTPMVMKIPTVSALFDANMRLRDEVVALQAQAMKLGGEDRLRAEAAIRDATDAVRRAREAAGGTSP